MKKIRVGRASDNDIVINDASVSRYHLEIIQESNGAIFATDLNSSNGTTVNGRRINGTYGLDHSDILKPGNANPLPWKNYLSSPQPNTIISNSVNYRENSNSYPSEKQSVPNSSAALVLGIVSLVFSIFPIFFITTVLSIVMGIIAISLGSTCSRLGRENSQKYTEGSLRNANAGKVMGIVGLVISFLWVIFLLFILAVGYNYNRYW